MVENIFQVGIFQGGIHQGGVWLVEIFRVGFFLKHKKICAKNSQVHKHWHWSSSEKSSFSKPIASIFRTPLIIIFSCGVEIFNHSLVQLIGHVSALIGDIEIYHYICSFLEFTRKTKVTVREYFCNGLYSWKLIFIRSENIGEVKVLMVI